MLAKNVAFIALQNYIQTITQTWLLYHYICLYLFGTKFSFKSTSIYQRL